MGFLTDLKIRTASPSAKEYLLADGDGLYLRVRASSKSWLYRYKSDEKQVKIGLGAYPTIRRSCSMTQRRKTLGFRSCSMATAARETAGSMRWATRSVLNCAV